MVGSLVSLEIDLGDVVIIEMDDPSASTVVVGKWAGGCGRGDSGLALSLSAARGVAKRADVLKERVADEKEGDVDDEDEEEAEADEPPQRAMPFEALRSASCLFLFFLMLSLEPSSVSGVKRSSERQGRESCAEYIDVNKTMIRQCV